MIYLGLLFLIVLCISLAYSWLCACKKINSLESKSQEIENQRLHWLQETNRLKNEGQINRQQVEKELDRKRVLLRLHANDLKKQASQLSEKEKALTHNLEEQASRLSQKEKVLTHNLEEQASRLSQKEKVLTAEKKLLDARVQDIPLLAKFASDTYLREQNIVAEFLENKDHPALNSAAIVRKINKEKSMLQAQLKEWEYRCTLYESIIPGLSDLDDEEKISDISGISQDELKDHSGDMARHYLSREEYDSLSDVEKYQLALDHWWNRKKTRSEIGADYERFIGYEMEKSGWYVQYNGIEKGLNDMGIDLICKKGNRYILVQCKNWSSFKTIHEKHINQLFGTTVDFYLTHINHNGSFADFRNLLEKRMVIPLFVTSTELSDTARKVASTLGVSVSEDVKFNRYPIIKCNINQSTGEKIYHLPFDQQYDKTVIDKSVGEFYALTVKEAEDHGFRRAKKHFFN